MHIAHVGQVPAFHVDGVTTEILLRWGSFGARNLLVAWTTIAPGGQQFGHAHPGTEQIYFIVSGTARMQVAEEKQIVGAGTLVYVPPGVSHSVANTGSGDLTYLTAASPPFPVERLYAEHGAAAVRT